MTEEHEYFEKRRPDKTYISSSILSEDRKIRIAKKVIDTDEMKLFAVEKDSLVIRSTSGGRQEIVAKFYEDDRKVFTLTIQKFTKKTGKPHRVHFSFLGEEINTLLDFINNLKTIYLPSDKKINIPDDELKMFRLSQTQTKNLISQNLDLFLDLARYEVTKEDIVALGFRKKQLEEFDKLLNDEKYFDNRKKETAMKDEQIWQAFFEKNKWVFGYGLTYISLAGLDGKKLEQDVAGHSILGPGKRIDALMKTKGAIEALCFVEIKTHKTLLLQSSEYRSGCWAPSKEVAGGVAQLQVTVESALHAYRGKVKPIKNDGNPTGEELFAYQPRSFLVVGCLQELQSANGINNDKYRSFELYRRNIIRPEIITFDELYHRVKFIVEHDEGKKQKEDLKF